MHYMIYMLSNPTLPYELDINKPNIQLWKQAHRNGYWTEATKPISNRLPARIQDSTMSMSMNIPAPCVTLPSPKKLLTTYYTQGLLRDDEVPAEQWCLRFELIIRSPRFYIDLKTQKS